MSQSGCEVILRPKVLAQDDTPMVPVALHALENLNERFEYLILLQPTCPLRSSQDIDEAAHKLKNANSKAVIGVYQVNDNHPARMYTLEENELKPLDARWERENRQNLPPVYHRNGVIYGIRTDVLVKEQTFIPRGSALSFFLKSTPLILIRRLISYWPSC